jgi:hypothetical protein
LKILNSDQKLEKKIKELEKKLDNLNNPSSLIEENQKEEENNLYDKYQLSDLTKEFLNTYLDDSEPAPELSDFSKAYMVGLSDDYNKESTNDERPALSGLTMQFLENNNNEEENKKNEEQKEENN